MPHAIHRCPHCGEPNCQDSCTAAIVANQDTEGLSRNPLVWAQRVNLNVTLFQALTAQGLLLLALRHPGTQTPGLPRETGEELVAVLSRLLVHGGAMTEATLRGTFFAEECHDGMTWADFEAACARIEARVAAMGQRNPETGV